MTISLTQVLIWFIIAAVVGVVGEWLARRCAPDGIVGAIIVAAIIVFVWSGFAYRRVQPYYARYYRRGGSVRRPRLRRWF